MALKRAGLTEADVAQSIRDRATARQVPVFGAMNSQALGQGRHGSTSLFLQGRFLGVNMLGSFSDHVVLGFCRRKTSKRQMQSGRAWQMSAS